MSDWVITIWVVGAGLLGAVETVSPMDTVLCHVRVAVGAPEAGGSTCPCGDVCDEDVEDEDVEDEDVEDQDACDGCDPDDEDERDDDEQDDD